MENTRIKKLLEFLNEEGNDPFLLYALATEYNNLGEKDVAFEYYLKLTNEHPAYTGTYYHLGKLYETTGQADKALAVYRKGMETAKEKKEMHAWSELQGAYNKAAGLDYEDD